MYVLIFIRKILSFSGNIPGWFPYTRGTPCTACTGSYTQCDNSLCSLSEFSLTVSIIKIRLIYQLLILYNKWNIFLLATSGSGQWSVWSVWSLCPVTCGTGTQTRSRTCLQQPCDPSQATQVQQCNTNTCPGTGGQWAQWFPWGGCSVTCGTGSQTRTRQCLVPPCDPSQGTQTTVCTLQPCTGDSNNNFLHYFLSLF